MEIVRCNDRPYEPAGHEDPRDPGVWRRLMFRRDELDAGRVQMVNWARMAPGKAFARHYHEDMQEVFLIVRGTVQIVVGEETATLQPGDAIRIDVREIHQMVNESDQDVEYVVFGIVGTANGKTVVVD